MANSVNTNLGALIALQNLNATNVELATTQTRINTGKKVGSAKDNGAIWAIAQGQRADIGALEAVKSSLDRGVSAVDVSLAAGESISDLLLQLKEKALAATDKSLSTASRERAERGLQVHPRPDQHGRRERRLQRDQPA